MRRRHKQFFFLCAIWLLPILRKNDKGMQGLPTCQL